MSKLTIVAAVAGLFLIGCQKKQIQSTEDKLTSGTWKVSGFVKDQADKTNAYDNDTYLFNEDGSIAVSGEHRTTGSWNVNGNTNSSFERMEVRLIMDGDCAALSGNWYISHETTDLIQFAEELENNEFNYLTLTRN